MKGGASGTELAAGTIPARPGVTGGGHYACTAAHDALALCSKWAGERGCSGVISSVDHNKQRQQ